MPDVSAPAAVVLDYYGTLAHATHWISADDVLAQHGYELPPETRDRWFNDGIDGIEHFEHSHSRDHYLAWQRERLLGMLAETDVHPGEYEMILEKLRHGAASRVLEAYPEVHGVLHELRRRGLRLAICSNWDWDLNQAVDEVGLSELVDVQVSSAWAGARKPHPRIFEDTLGKLGVDAAACVFVGDTWGPDVAGPRAMGMTPVYLSRDGHWPDPTAPRDIEPERVAVAEDLRGVLDHV
ncbi:MAG TPA: HAD family hydrolase [Acidimicrobiia bacterium]|nr:HAD family hydrolase [Acidimicrobiia bacterium]